MFRSRPHLDERPGRVEDEDRVLEVRVGQSMILAERRILALKFLRPLAVGGDDDDRARTFDTVEPGEVMPLRRDGVSEGYT